jgi:hypothetical protein
MSIWKRVRSPHAPHFSRSRTSHGMAPGPSRSNASERDQVTRWRQLRHSIVSVSVGLVIDRARVGNIIMAAASIDAMFHICSLGAMSQSGRRFPPPWNVIEHIESYEIRDASGFALAYVYFLHPKAVKLVDQKQMTQDQARRIASNIAKLPELLRK